MFDPSQTAAQCPFHQTDQAVSGLTGSEELVLPVNKRAIIQYSHDDSGTPELHIYYDDKEIAFDEPELFAFGEALAKQTLFKASSATTWGGAGYHWSQVKPLLEHLLDEGILHFADRFDNDSQQTS